MGSNEKHPKSKNTPPSPGESILGKYRLFRKLQTLNNESLEMIADLQEDLRCVPPISRYFAGRIGQLFEKARDAVDTLGDLYECSFGDLGKKLGEQEKAVVSYLRSREEAPIPPVMVPLSEVSRRDALDVGGKAAVLGEIKNRLEAPVPDGFVLTTRAYDTFCGTPLWETIRDETTSLAPDDLKGVERCSRVLTEAVATLPMPGEITRALETVARSRLSSEVGWAVRSSAVGEGETRTFAGQFRSLLNVRPEELESAYRSVVASRFETRALIYRSLMGFSEVESPMAVVLIPTIDAEASGIMYSRDPKHPKTGGIVISAARGLSADIAAGIRQADLFVVDRRRGHRLLEDRVVPKGSALILGESGGVTRVALEERKGSEASLGEKDLARLAAWAVRLEKYFRSPQDIEWVLGRDGRLWIVQSRSLAMVSRGKGAWRLSSAPAPLLSGGRTIFPGRTSGSAYKAADAHRLAAVPAGSILITGRPSPELVKVLPRLAGVVAEKGTLTGHGAALLREFRVPSVFGMEGSLGAVAHGAPVSLDASSCKVYEGILWHAEKRPTVSRPGRGKEGEDPIHSRILALTLSDPDELNFRPRGCKSLHDVLRYSHELAVEAMFTLNDAQLAAKEPSFRRVVTSTPMDLRVLDLGGGLSPKIPEGGDLGPEDIVSRPFRALWTGVCHEGVSWSREAAPSVGGFASVLARSLSEQHASKRALGDVSYLLVGSDHMNLNARMAYHFTMVDACLSSIVNHNYVSFRFAGGGAGRSQRGLRARFIQAVLSRYGYYSERRGDLVNAWLEKADEKEMEEKLDILGRLLVCASQLDMYMTSQEAMAYYVDRFMAEDYSLVRPSHEEVRGKGDRP